MRAKKYLIAAALLFLVVAVLVGVKVMQIRSMMAAGANFTMPPETISSTEVRRVRWETVDSAIGTVAPVQGVLLRTEVSGLVSKIAFESGASVKKGDVLIELDQSSEDAALQSARAREEVARVALQRARRLHAEDVLAKSSLDLAVAAVEQTGGDAQAARVAAAKKVIRAPFDGRLGIRQIQLGQFAEVGTPIVPLQSLDPVHVNFSLPEQAAGHLQAGMNVRVTTDAVPGRTFDGTLTAVNPEVDASSRNVHLQATFSGTEGLLMPGMFAQVELVLPQVESPLVVPVTAVLNAPYGDSVFVIADVKDEKTGKVSRRVRMTTVKLGRTRGDLVVVEHGLEEGQEIASSGVFKLRNDVEIVVNNDLAPPAETNPQPSES